jgi:hypothetical protein
MNESANNLTCAEFQALLPELLDSPNSLSQHPHLQHCDNCRALLTNLESIAEAVRHLFPVVEPPDTLWGQIELAIKREEADSATAS